MSLHLCFPHILYDISLTRKYSHLKVDTGSLNSWLTTTLRSWLKSTLLLSAPHLNLKNTDSGWRRLHVPPPPSHVNMLVMNAENIKQDHKPAGLKFYLLKNHFQLHLSFSGTKRSLNFISSLSYWNTSFFKHKVSNVKKLQCMKQSLQLQMAPFKSILKL